MKNFVFAVAVLILTYGCGSDDSPQGASTIGIEGTWDVIETDTNVDSIIIIQGTSFSFDSQLTGESYEGEIHGSTVGNTRRLNVRVTQTSEPQFIGLTSLCIYTVNSNATQSTLACNPPGHSEYPTDYVSTNLTRVFELTKRSSVVTPARLIGTWTSNCTVGIEAIVEILNTTDQSMTVTEYTNGDCTGAIIQSVELSGTYEIGNAVTVTDSGAGTNLTAYEYDFMQTLPIPTTIYNIVYIDDNGVLYLGDTTQELDGSSPALRPNVIFLGIPYEKTP